MEYPMFKKSLVIQGIYRDSPTHFDSLMHALQATSAQNFYDAVEFSFFGSPEQYQEIRDLLTELHLESIFLAGYEIKTKALNLGSSDFMLRKHAVERVKELVDISYYLGSKKMLILSGPDYQPGERANALEKTARSVKEICAYARAKDQNYDLKITLEFFNNEGEPYLLLGPVNTMLDFAKEIRTEWDNFELTYDLSHVLQLGDDPIDAYKKLSPYTGHIHLANCVVKDRAHPLYGDKHPPFGFEAGEVVQEDLEVFLRKMFNVGFPEGKNIFIGPEIITPGGSDPDAICSDVTDLFKAVINKEIRRERPG